MSLRGQVEAIIYAAEEPVSIEQIASAVRASLPLDDKAAIEAQVRETVQILVSDYAADERGIEITQVAGGYRMATKPEHHDVVRAFAKGLKPPIRLSLPALETLAVIAYKQPVTAPEISEVRGVDASGVLATLMDRKLITTAGRKAVIGRPILYKTTKEFLLRFGLNDLNELPSVEEFERLAGDSLAQQGLFEGPLADATGTSSSEEPASEPVQSPTA
jgi:segregation and condensation protein B